MMIQNDRVPQVTPYPTKLVGVAARIHVDEHCGAQQSAQRNLIDSPTVLEEVDRRIDVRAPVLGHAKSMCGVVVALVGRALWALFEHETLFGRPEDGFRIERVGEIDDLPFELGACQPGGQCPPEVFNVSILFC